MRQASRSHHPDKSSGTVPCRNIHEIVSLSVCNLSACHLSDITTGITIFSDVFLLIGARGYYFISVGISCKELIKLLLCIFTLECLACELTSIGTFGSYIFYPAIPHIYIHVVKRTIDSRIFFYCIYCLHRAERIFKFNNTSKNLKISCISRISRFCKSSKSTGIILTIHGTES